MPSLRERQSESVGCVLESTPAGPLWENPPARSNQPRWTTLGNCPRISALTKRAALVQPPPAPARCRRSFQPFAHNERRHPSHRQHVTPRQHHRKQHLRPAESRRPRSRGRPEPRASRGQTLQTRRRPVPVAAIEAALPDAQAMPHQHTESHNQSKPPTQLIPCGKPRFYALACVCRRPDLSTDLSSPRGKIQSNYPS